MATKLRGAIMFTIKLEFITGVSLGVEFITHEELGEEGDGWVFILDLLIFRVLLEKSTIS